MSAEAGTLDGEEEANLRAQDAMLTWTTRRGSLWVKRMTEDWQTPYPEEVAVHRLLATLAAARGEPGLDVERDERLREEGVNRERTRLLGNFDEFKEWMTDNERGAAAAVLFIHRPVDWTEDERQRVVYWGQRQAARFAAASSVESPASSAETDAVQPLATPTTPEPDQ